MRKLLFILTIFVLTNNVKAQSSEIVSPDLTTLQYDILSEQHAEKKITYECVEYLIKYSYSPGIAFVPLTYPPGSPHYAAKIDVLKCTDKGYEMIAIGIDGTYVDGGCFEDMPEDWIKKALQIQKIKK